MYAALLYFSSIFMRWAIVFFSIRVCVRVSIGHFCCCWGCMMYVMMRYVDDCSSAWCIIMLWLWVREVAVIAFWLYFRSPFAYNNTSSFATQHNPKVSYAMTTRLYVICASYILSPFAEIGMSFCICHLIIESIHLRKCQSVCDCVYVLKLSVSRRKQTISILYWLHFGGKKIIIKKRRKLAFVLCRVGLVLGDIVAQWFQTHKRMLKVTVR